MEIAFPRLALAHRIESALRALDQGRNVLLGFQPEITRDIIEMKPLRDTCSWIAVQHSFHRHDGVYRGVGTEAPTPPAELRRSDSGNDTMSGFVVDLKPPLDERHPLIGVTRPRKVFDPIGP